MVTLRVCKKVQIRLLQFVFPAFWTQGCLHHVTWRVQHHRLFNETHCERNVILFLSQISRVRPVLPKFSKTSEKGLGLLIPTPEKI